VVDEVRECVERFGLNEFLFHGDTFTINKRWLLELCGLLIDADLGVRWGCNSRVDTIDDERAEAMRRAGCWVVAFGVESGSQEMLDKMKKRAKIKDAYRAIEVCKRNGLLTHAFYLIGAPWETRETLAKTYELARKLDTDFFDFNLAFPLPGTELHQLALDEGLLEHELGATTGYAQAAMRSYTLSAAELTRCRKRMLLKLSFRPGYIVRTLRRASRDGMLGSYLAAGGKRLKHLLLG
jgi:radical SAM superfamily enzyme YgiQ (UPF0313 family)